METQNISTENFFRDALYYINFIETFEMTPKIVHYCYTYSLHTIKMSANIMQIKRVI